MSTPCSFDGCTVAETGTCALARDPATCDRRSVVVSPKGEAFLGLGASLSEISSAVGAPVLEKPNDTVAFAASRTLSLETMSNIMASRYVTVVGILGDPESGKTACLASLYLLVSNARLKGWRFADSKSLMAFEDIARGARDWNQGTPPEQMTVHTEMADDRQPGFLHLRLTRDSDGRTVDLALPDLPGEWTTTLVNTARVDRFEFIKSAEAIWMVVDGRTLANIEKRQGAIVRIGQLVGRLRAIFGAQVPRLTVVVTHRDESGLQETTSALLASELAKHEVAVKVVEVASFSDNDNIKPGLGLVDLIDFTVTSSRASAEFWPTTNPRTEARSFEGYRRDR